MPEVIVIADDLSGAADTGASFAERGYQTVVIWDFSSFPSADTLVISTESRHIPRERAVAKIKSVISQLPNTGDSPLIYKKIDSTLRGHPAAELAAVMGGFGIAKALVAPAFPTQKRVTVSGIHYVDGLPLDQTTFGDEVKTSNLRELFEINCVRYEVVLLGLDTIRKGEDAIADELRKNTSEWMIIVADAETMEDLTALVKAAQSEDFRLFCGSAGLAAALAETSEHKATTTNLGDFIYNGVGILGVIASRRINTVQQIIYAKAHGIPVLCPDVAWFLNPTVSVHPVAKDLHKLLLTNKMVLLTVHELPDLSGKSTLICSRMASAVSELMLLTSPAGLILSGGDMAIALSSMLKARAIVLRGEIQAGIPWGYLLGGRAHGCPIVTKAGGFGEETVLLDACKFLAIESEISG